MAPASTPPRLSPGHASPLGATVTLEGVNFSVYSKYATAVELLLFEHGEAAAPSLVLPLDPCWHRTYHYWHVHVEGIGPGQIYGYRVSGPWQPERGLRFDGANLLLDPYAPAVLVPKDFRRRPGRSSATGLAGSMKSVVADLAAFDWEGDRPLQRPRRETVIYELHVRGFTRHPSSEVAADRAGTYLGLIEKIPYLQELGVTAVELLPVQQFDPLDAPAGRRNYWGYAPVSLLAVHSGYGCSGEPLEALDEFRTMVKALHRAGIEVIVDVVFNHTAEGDERGPGFCFRGLANEAYYHLLPGGGYADYSGCGNTLNANHQMLRRMIRHSLRHWVQNLHVDGFRFDLASVLARDEQGQMARLPAVLWDLETDPVLAGTKLIAEAWDAAGLYQVGSFIGDSWQEWNGRFRDDIRRFVKSDAGQVPMAALRLLGSPDIYGHEEREAEQSVNFITCHDGFTLADLVSYNHKHNEANGESNRDGSDDNASWNCGVEGPTEDPAVLELRRRQVRNLLTMLLLTMLLLAVGTPMLSMGDEVLRSQRGNDNAYCWDDPLTWFDWGIRRSRWSRAPRWC
ncbi:glycogen-debranching protein [Cyanobium sp. CH-040]|uniref:glycogen debranching protein n=1 Tax=Cyanobium sp. CH-040 TaxID=2823708 RepID=UPI0020CEAAAE|nr:isoamylase [Cyanobium sp. CH-040]MCP9927682.1 glycogen-debranching protein [Cyanobium sp. CH-040]